MLKKIDAATILRYWAEPDYFFVAKDVTFWHEDDDIISCTKRSSGYLPVYETREEAEEAHPGCEIIEIMVSVAQEH